MSGPATPSERGSSSQSGRRGSTAETTVQVRSPRSILKALRVVPCAAAVVRPLMTERHYLHSMPGVVRECFAVYLADELVGGAVFTAGARHAHRLLQGAAPAHVLTLSRFWMDDGLPPNGESRVLGVILRDLARRRAHKLVVSFADPAAGHVGTIYQASGWTYTGRTEAERYLIVDGLRVHPRSASTKYGSNSLGHLRRTGLRAERVMSPPKHRYAYVLDPAWRWRLGGRREPYPKRGGRDPPPDGSVQGNGLWGAATPHRPRPNERSGHADIYRARQGLSNGR